MSSISSISTNQAYYQKQLFSKLDTDSNGKVSKEEFVNGKPSDVTESIASVLFDKLDTSGSGSLSESDLTNMQSPPPPDGNGQGMASLRGTSNLDLNSILSLLENLESDSDTSSSTSTSSSVSGKDMFAKMFAKMDADGSGTISKDEFVAARPPGQTEEQSADLYDSIDTEGTGALTEQQLAEGLPPPPPPGGMGMASAMGGSNSGSDLEATLESILNNYNSTETNSTTSTTSTDTARSTSSTSAIALLEQFLEAVRSYTTSSNYAVNFDATSALSATA